MLGVCLARKAFYSYQGSSRGWAGHAEGAGCEPQYQAVHLPVLPGTGNAIAFGTQLQDIFY